MKVQIQPVTIFPDTATQFEIIGVNIRRLASDGQAYLAWQLKSATDSQLTVGTLEITGAEYQGWNDDDPYLMDLALSRLGLTKV